jgi:tRNA pseudouridine38-40 synthase
VTLFDASRGDGPAQVKMVVAYDGTEFSGFAEQPQQPHVRTVGGTLAKAIGKVLRHPVDLACAGRTDAGVHGVCQVVHFDTEAQRDPRGWTLGACSNLPAGVAVLWAQPVAEDFHARFAARSRRYRYTLLNRPVRAALQARYVTWERLPLDAGRMHAAAQALLGEHDFSAFRAASCQAAHANRCVLAIGVRREGEQVIVEIEANAFLHHMVRNIVGSLLPVGRGERPVEWLAELLAGRDREAAGPTALPNGLAFVGPRYEARWGLPAEVSQ